MKKSIMPVMAGCLAAAAYAPYATAKSTIGGIVFTNVYSSSVKDNAGNKVDKTVVEVPGNSRLRVRWDNEDRVSMYVELGLGSSASLRHAWGKWDFSEKWQLLAGHTSTPFAPLNPSIAMVHNSGDGVANTNPGRQPQVRLTYKFENRQGAVAFAILDPNNGDTLQDQAVANTDLGTKDASLPRFDIGAAFNTFNVQLFPSFFYQKQTYTNLATAGSDDEVDTWGASLGIRTAFGPVTLTAEYGTGQNWGNTRMSLSGSPAGENAAAVTYLDSGVTRIADTDNEAFWVDVGYRFTGENVQGVAHFIYGFINSETDGNNGAISRDYETKTMGVSVPIDLPWIARGFRIRPEIFRFDHGTSQVDGTSTDEGDETIYGVQFQYTF